MVEGFWSSVSRVYIYIYTKVPIATEGGSWTSH